MDRRSYQTEECKEIMVKKSMTIYNTLGNNILCNGEQVPYPTGLHSAFKCLAVFTSASTCMANPGE